MAVVRRPDPAPTSRVAEPPVDLQADNSRHERVAVREQLVAHRSRRRVRANRHLGALPAAARRALLVRLRERRTRHADDAARRAGRHCARGAHQARERRSQARLRDVSHQRGQLHHHARSRERGAHDRAVPPARRARLDRAQGHQAGVRPRAADVPARPLRARHVPALRHARSVRRLVRELRPDVFAARPQGRRVDALRHEARGARVRAPVPRARPVPRRAARVGAEARRRRARAQARRVVRRGPQGLGHLARPALLRLPHSGRARQVLLRVVRRADRLHGELPEPVPAREARLRRVLGRRQPARSSITSSARTFRISTRCSGRRCCRARAIGSRAACSCTAI